MPDTIERNSALVEQLFGHLRGDLEQHLIHKELVLFPALSAADREAEAAVLMPGIIAEHEGAGHIPEELSHLTNSYSVPADRCTTFAKAYQILSELEDDLHRHIHLENNIIFKAYDIR